MKAIKLDKKLLSQAFISFTFVLSIFPILTYQLRSIVIVIWTLLGLISLTSKHIEPVKLEIGKTKLLLLISLLPFILLTTSLIYSLDLNSGLKRLVQMLPFLLFPIIFYLNRKKFEESLINRVCWVFSISVLLLVVYQIFQSLLNLDMLLADLTNKELSSNNLSNSKVLEDEVINKLKTRRFRNFILDLTNSHFTYQGLWIIFSIFFVTNETFKLIQPKKRWGYLLLPIILLMLIWLFIISSRMPIVVLLISSIIVLLILKKVRIKTLVWSTALAILALVSSYYIFTTFQVRVNEILKTKFELPTSGDDIENYSSINVRNGIYFCSYIVIKDNIWLGTGVGDSQHELNNCYQDKIGAKIYTWKNYNTHNQYLFFFLATGLLGFLMFLLLIYVHLRKSLIYKSQIYLYFIIIISLISLTENILSRSDGVIFFAFFSGLFLFNARFKS